jgi:hypothetical protein
MSDTKLRFGALGLCVVTVLGLIALCGGSAGAEVWCGNKRA